MIAQVSIANVHFILIVVKPHNFTICMVLFYVAGYMQYLTFLHLKACQIYVMYRYKECLYMGCNNVFFMVQSKKLH
jgi:hypothetical protein